MVSSCQEMPCTPVTAPIVIETALRALAHSYRRSGALALAEAVDPRLISEEDEVDTLGGLIFLLAGRIPAKGECVVHPTGWRLEAVDADPRRILRVRLHAPQTDKPSA